jgi:cytochrome P450
VGSLERRLEALEGRATPPENKERSEARERMRAVLDELAAAKREGREPSEEAAAIMEGIQRRRARES